MVLILLKKFLKVKKIPEFQGNTKTAITHQ